jgi:outer membrane protein assembly factor BamB
MTADSSGDLRALSLATGKTLWTHATGGPISAAPMLTGKIAYAGSGHSVVAVSETTGTPLWSYATGGTVAATPALTTFATGGIPLLFAGSDDGTLYAINGTTGTLQWSLAHGQPIAGIATIDSVVVFDTTAGDVVAGRTYTSLKLWTVTTSPAGITAPPAIIDGAVYIGGGDGDLYAFTGYGQPPP